MLYMHMKNKQKEWHPATKPYKKFKKKIIINTYTNCITVQDRSLIQHCPYLRAVQQWIFWLLAQQYSAFSRSLN